MLPRLQAPRVRASLSLTQPHVIPLLTPIQIDYDPAQPGDPWPWRVSRQMLENSRHYLLHTPLGEVQLAVQNDYLDEDALQRVAKEIYLARTQIPALYGSYAKKIGMITVYIYDEPGPLTHAGAPGPHAHAHEAAVFVGFAKEGHDPLVHELTHLFEPGGDTFAGGSHTSESLSEGFARYVQTRFMPDHDPKPATPTLNAAARDALNHYPELLSSIGADTCVTFGGPRSLLTQGQLRRGDDFHFNRRFYAADARDSFYFASESFIRFLIEQRGGLQKLAAVQAAGGTEAIYEKVYGASLDALRTAWLQRLAGEAVEAGPCRP